MDKGDLISGQETVLASVSTEGSGAYGLTDRRLISIEPEGGGEIHSVNYTAPSIVGVHIEKAGPAEPDENQIILGIIVAVIGVLGFLIEFAVGLVMLLFFGLIGAAIIYDAYQQEREDHTIRLLTDDEDTDPFAISVPADSEEFVDTVHRALAS
jgi:hypothetical protein